ncbi:hypothetical protein TNCV_2160481 [Trichonephila clavipes]|nr:hypothetical protein TNCV_2160481 [Trichonephila clavipes]
MGNHKHCMVGNALLARKRRHKTQERQDTNTKRKRVYCPYYSNEAVKCLAGTRNRWRYVSRSIVSPVDWPAQSPDLTSLLITFYGTTSRKTL